MQNGQIGAAAHRRANCHRSRVRATVQSLGLNVRGEERKTESKSESVYLMEDQLTKRNSPKGKPGDGGSPAGGHGVRYRIGVAEKAGMSQVDRKRVNEKIYELSKNSRFYQNERRKEEKLQLRIAAMEEKLRHIREKGGRAAQRTITAIVNSTEGETQGGRGGGGGGRDGTAAVAEEVDRIVRQMEGWRRMDRVYIHVDMDAFYASVEIRDNPALKDVPMAVGGMGMLSTSNYLARAFGVRSAMPGFIGKELCPDLVFVPFSSCSSLLLSLSPCPTHKDQDGNRF